MIPLPRSFLDPLRCVSIKLPAFRGKTNKKEWDQFDRQTRSATKFPASLKPMLVRRKQDLFAIWLDNQMDLDRVKCEVERQQATLNLSRKEWTAVKAKDLQKQYSQERYDDIVQKRTEAGLYYLDDDYPNDPLDPLPLLLQRWGINALLARPQRIKRGAHQPHVLRSGCGPIYMIKSSFKTLCFMMFGDASIH